MREKLRRYGKRVMVFICTLVIFAGSVFSFSFESKASDVFYYEMPFAEPSTSVNSGYITVLLASHGETNPNKWFPYVFQWNVMPENDSSNVSSSSMSLNIQKDGRIYFSANQGQVQLCTITVFCLTDNGAYHTMWTDISADDTWYRVVDYSSGFDIIGYKVFGNYGTVSDDFSYGENIAYNISWSTDDLLHQYLFNMYSEQIQSNKNDSTMISKLTDIFNSVDSVENKLDELKELQNESNTWLEKIWNSIQEFLGKEPAEDAAPSVDEDNMLGSMEETEDALFPDTSEAEQSLNVQLNSGFSVLTWLVESFAKMDAGVFSMFLTMLTFGVMALLLGR